MKVDELNYCPRCGKTLIKSSLPMVCSSDACRYQIWLNPIPVIAVLCETASGIILARNKAWPDNVYGAITGFIEHCEDPADAVVRETEEELGLTITGLNLLGVYNYADMNQTIIAYHALVKGNISLGNELSSYKEIPLHKLKAWPFGTGLAVAELLRRYQQDQPD